MGRHALFNKPLALQNAETVLLVHDYQSEPLKSHGILNQRMRADDELCCAAFHACESVAPLETLLAANNQFHLVPSSARRPIAMKYSSSRKVMLGGENFRWRHQGHLITVLDCDRGRFECHNRLSASDITFEQPMHWIWQLQIGCDFGEHALLCSCRLERQDSLQCFASFVLADAHRDSGAAVFLLASQGESELIIEEFFEDQTNLRRAAPAVQQLQVFVLRRKMRVKQRLAACRELVTFANRGGQRVRNIGIEIV